MYLGNFPAALLHPFFPSEQEREIQDENTNPISTSNFRPHYFKEILIGWYFSLVINVPSRSKRAKLTRTQ
jgi:hypothetical protein